MDRVATHFTSEIHVLNIVAQVPVAGVSCSSIVRRHCPVADAARPIHYPAGLRTMPATLRHDVRGAGRIAELEEGAPD
jgi:hypothetical protein